MRVATVSFLLCAALIAITALPAAATTHVVRPDGTGDFPTIQAAIDACAGGDIIELTDGTFVGAGNRDIDFSGKAVEVRSQSGTPFACVVDCEAGPGDPHRGFVFQSGEGPTTVLSGVAIIHGYQFSPGGGLLCDASSPTISDCWFFTNNTPDMGAGVFCQDCSPTFTGCVFLENGSGGGLAGGGMACMQSSPTITDCVFRRNLCQSAAGLYCFLQSAPILRECHFEENTAIAAGGYGGGLFAFNASPELYDCTFEGNAADRGAGIAFYNYCNPILERCSFVDNSAHDGGGAYCLYYASPDLTDCTFWGNHAVAYGGAIWCGDSAPTLERCTLVADSAGIAGGGMHLNRSDPTLENTIIAFATGGSAVYCYDGASAPLLSCCDLYGNAGGDWVGCIASQAGVSGNIALDPLFCDGADGDFRLDSDSPCAPFTDPNPECDLIGAWSVGCSSSIDEGQAAWVDRMALSCAPNPITGAATITFRIPDGTARQSVSLAILDASGRVVRTLLGPGGGSGSRGTPNAGKPSAATHNFRWDGTDRRGQPLPGGAYFYRVRIGAVTATRTLVLIR